MREQVVAAQRAAAMGEATTPMQEDALARTYLAEVARAAERDRRERRKKAKAQRQARRRNR
jgi:hypothetical protein